MCNCYGSHVLRTLLCLCRGVPLDKCGYYLSKSTTLLAERLNSKEFSKKDDATNFLPGFPNLLKVLVSDMLKHAKKYIKTLQVDQFSSLVFQVSFPSPSLFFYIFCIKWIIVFLRAWHLVFTIRLWAVYCYSMRFFVESILIFLLWLMVGDICSFFILS